MKMIGKDNFQNIEKFRNYSNEVSLVDKDLERTFTAGTVLSLDHQKSSGFCETANFRFEVGTGSPNSLPEMTEIKRAKSPRHYSHPDVSHRY